MKARSFLLTAGILLMGCGSSDFASLTTSSGPSQLQATSNGFSARVVNESGQGVGQVEVVVHHRQTNLKYTATTSSDGSFRLNIPEGVYDLGLNKASDPSSATCFYGPLIHTGGAQGIFVLRATGGRSTDTLFGRVVRSFTAPSPVDRIVLRPSIIHGGSSSDSGKLQPLEPPTSVDGSFEAHLNSSQPTSLDIEVYDKTGLDEFIDVAKLEKACYVEFSSEDSSVENRLRANESDGPERLFATRPRREAVLPKLEKLFTGTVGTSKLTGAPLATLTDGLISSEQIATEDTPNIYAIKDIVQPNPNTGAEESLIWVADDGMWWWKYAVQIRGQEGVGTEWWFTDETNDTYSLYIFGQFVALPIPAALPLSASWHKVSYNSSKPNIKKIVYRL